jgi:predicted enzyme related to lactoylglutathione lyase
MSAKPRLVGIELYFENLPEARRFYQETLGLELLEDEPGHHAKFDGQSAFVCLERKGVESYPSKDKAVIFLEVTDLQSTIDAIGVERFVGFGEKNMAGRIPWAVLHDPQGHNILLLEAKRNG